MILYKQGEVYSDENDRAIISKIVVGGDGAKIGEEHYFSQVQVGVQDNQGRIHQPTFPFKIEASSIYEAFEKLDSESKRVGEEIVEKMKIENRKAALASGATSGIKLPNLRIK